MKKFKVIRNFLGAQDGAVVTEFEAGTVVEISDHLAPHISEWAVPFVEGIASAQIDDDAPSSTTAPTVAPPPQPRQNQQHGKGKWGQR